MRHTKVLLLWAASLPLLAACHRPTSASSSPAPSVAVVSSSVAATPLVTAPSNEGPTPTSGPLRRLAEPAAGAYVDSVRVSMHCVLGDDGAVSCVWGELAPKRIPGVGMATQIVAGHGFVCALERQGTVACFNGDTTTTTAERVKLPFRVRRIAGNERGLVLEAEEGGVHWCALPFEGPLSSCTLTKLDVPDVDAYVDAGLRHCSLDRSRAPSCSGVASDNDDRGDQPISVPGFPKKVRRLVEGLASYETGAVVCAIGAAGELACSRGFEEQAPGHTGFIAKVEPIALPGPVRDLAIGASLGRVVLEDGRVYAIPMSLTRRYPAGWKMFVAEPVPLSEPADSVSETCVRYRSGRVECAR